MAINFKEPQQLTEKQTTQFSGRVLENAQDYILRNPELPSQTLKGTAILYASALAGSENMKTAQKAVLTLENNFKGAGVGVVKNVHKALEAALDPSKPEWKPKEKLVDGPRHDRELLAELAQRNPGKDKPRTH